MSDTRGGYRILDEPTPGSLGGYVVNPTFPMLALMLAGTWLAAPWFAFNALALGSPTARREIGLAVAMLAGAFLLVFGLLVANEQGLISAHGMAYWALIPIVRKLGFGYWLFMLQSRTFHLYEHFDGRVRNGLFLLLLGAFVMRSHVLDLIRDPLWILTVA
jgi:hypothetical protein